MKIHLLYLLPMNDSKHIMLRKPEFIITNDEIDQINR